MMQGPAGRQPQPASTLVSIGRRTDYFTSQRDGHLCLWAQRLDAGSHRPAGAPFAVEHLHGHLFYRVGGWSAAGGHIAMVLNESAGNVWMMSGGVR